jgi:hypothetical protein
LLFGDAIISYRIFNNSEHNKAILILLKTMTKYIICYDKI